MKMKFLNRLWKDTKGATAVEFGMVAVLFLLMIFGTIELGRIFWVYNTMQSALEQTARRFFVDRLRLSVIPGRLPWWHRMPRTSERLARGGAPPAGAPRRAMQCHPSDERRAP